MNSLKGLATVGIAFWLMFLGGCEAIQTATSNLPAGQVITTIQRGAENAMVVPTTSFRSVPLRPVPTPSGAGIIVPTATPDIAAQTNERLATIAATLTAPTSTDEEWHAPFVVPDKCRDWHPPMARMPECASPLLQP